VEADLRKLAVFYIDELKLNNHFIENEEIVIIPHDADKIVRIIGAFYKKPDKLRRIAKKGATKMRELAMSARFFHASDCSKVKCIHPGNNISL